MSTANRDEIVQVVQNLSRQRHQILADRTATVEIVIRLDIAAWTLDRRPLVKLESRRGSDSVCRC